MKERPILFSGPMVKAILEGRKTQTRRVVKGVSKLTTHFTDYQHLDGSFEQEGVCLEVGKIRCPHGVVGDRLWVKEKFLIETSGSCRYDAEGLSAGQYPGWLQRASIVHYASTTDLKTLGAWKSPQVMPRWASRITLEITEIRAQRLQHISRDDAAAEGICWLADEAKAGRYNERVDGLKVIQPHEWPEQNFKRLWDRINGKKHPFESNPWVWAISFKRVVE